MHAKVRGDIYTEVVGDVYKGQVVGDMCVGCRGCIQRLRGICAKVAGDVGKG